MKHKLKSIALGTLLLGLALSGCDRQPAQSGSDKQGVDQGLRLTEIKIGLVGNRINEWVEAAKVLEKKGIKLSIVKFRDYYEPNKALAAGQIDLNAFQHKAFLHYDVRNNGYDISVLADTVIAPLGLYSGKIKSLEEIKEGDTIMIADDLSNGGRALKALEAANLLKLDPGKGYAVDVTDITENPKKLKIRKEKAGRIPELLKEATAGFINTNFAMSHNLHPETDAIFTDTINIDKNNPYINVIVVRTQELNRPEFKTILEAYVSKATIDIINDEYKGAYIPVFKVPD